MYDSLEFEHSSTVERVADALRKALFSGEISRGTPLREVGLADSLGVGRSTVREALAQLAAEGLVTRIPNRGVIVTEHDPEQVHDVVRARLALEVAGARSWGSADESGRAGVRTAVTHYRDLAETGQATAQELSEAHLGFHISLVGLTGSTRLVSVAESLAAEIRLALAHVDRVRGNVAQQVRAHEDLLKRLESGDLEGVATELGSHLHQAETSIRQAVEQHTVT